MVGSIPLRNAFTIYEARKLWILLHPFITPNLNPVFMHWTKIWTILTKKLFQSNTSQQDIFSLKRRKGEWSQFGRFIETHSPLMLSDSWAHKGFHWSAINSFLFITRNTLLHKTFNCLHLQDPGKMKKKCFFLLLIISNFSFFLSFFIHLQSQMWHSWQRSWVIFSLEITLFVLQFIFFCLFLPLLILVGKSFLVLLSEARNRCQNS